MLSNQHHAVMRVTALSTQEKNIRLWHVLLEVRMLCVGILQLPKYFYHHYTTPNTFCFLLIDNMMFQMMDQTMDPVKAQAMDPVKAQAMDLEKDLG